MQYLTQPATDETRPMRLEALLEPRSIAILGASANSASLGHIAVANLRDIGFPGSVYPINPKYEEILGYRCYASVDELPESVDLIAFFIGHSRILPEYEKVAAKGIGAAVIFDSGFAELGSEGRALQDRVVALSREAGVALCGPNCMGVLNPHGPSQAYLQPMTDPEALAGNVGIISQSGSVLIGMTVDVRRFAYSHVISSGNEAVINAAAYVEWLVDDPKTGVIGLFSESIHEPDRFVAALDKAADAGKPVVVLKVGKNQRTCAAITTHTGGLAGESRVLSEVLRAHRAIEVDDLDEMTEVLAVCQGRRLPRGRRHAVVTASGGQAELILDLAEEVGIKLDPLPQDLRQEIECVVGPLMGDGNPVDAWGHGEYDVNFPHTFNALGRSDYYDTISFVSEGMDGQPIDNVERVKVYATLLAEAAGRCDKPVFYQSMRAGIFRTDHRDILSTAGVPIIGGTRQGLLAVDKVAAAMVGPLPPRNLSARESISLNNLLCSGRTVLHEVDAKQILAEAGVAVVEERLVATAEDATVAAQAIGYPVVLKVVADALAHKTERGLVELGLEDDHAVQVAWGVLEKRLSKIEPIPAIAGMVVQRMMNGGIEAIAGIKRDPDFGLVMVVGPGGVLVEILDQVALRPLPLRAGDAEAMIDETVLGRLLDGVRGQPGDREALGVLLYALADFAFHKSAEITEIDLNPIIVSAPGEGCAAVDALIVPLREG